MGTLIILAGCSRSGLGPVGDDGDAAPGDLAPSDTDAGDAAVPGDAFVPGDDACGAPFADNCTELFCGELNGCGRSCGSSTDCGCPGGGGCVLIGISGVTGRLYRSMEQGASPWTELPPTGLASPAAVSLTGTRAQTLYLKLGQSADTLARSQDGGQSWVVYPGWEAWGYFALCAHPTQDLLYGTDGSGTLYRSDDAGQTMTEVGTWPSGAQQLDCVVSPKDGAILVADSPTVGGKTYISYDLGQSFTARGIYSDTGANNVGLAVSASGTFYAVDADNRVFRSPDDGASWNLLGAIPPEPNVTIAYKVVVLGDGTLLAATPPTTSIPGYLYISTDDGTGWTRQSDPWAPGTGSGGGWIDMIVMGNP